MIGGGRNEVKVVGRGEGEVGMRIESEEVVLASFGTVKEGEEEWKS